MIDNWHHCFHVNYYGHFSSLTYRSLTCPFSQDINQTEYEELISLYTDIDYNINFETMVQKTLIDYIFYQNYLNQIFPLSFENEDDLELGSISETRFMKRRLHLSIWRKLYKFIHIVYPKGYEHIFTCEYVKKSALIRLLRSYIYMNIEWRNLLNTEILMELINFQIRLKLDSSFKREVDAAKNELISKYMKLLP